MIELLRLGAVAAPRAVAEAPASDQEGVGFVTASFERGSLFLEDAAGERLRLAWALRSRSRESAA